MINAMTLILICKVNLSFLDVTFLAVLLMAYTFHNLLGLLGLLESAIMLRTSMHEINV